MNALILITDMHNSDHVYREHVLLRQPDINIYILFLLFYFIFCQIGDPSEMIL